MKTPTPTITLKELRKEYLVSFIDFRRMWQQAKEDGTAEDVEFFWTKMRYFASLIDLTTRLENSLKGNRK